MKADFDHIATNYDASFTNTLIGKAQRNLVYASLEAIFPSLKGINVLEINCGTGADALRFSEQGANVIATDISPSMINYAIEKSIEKNNVSFEVLDINKLTTFHPEKTFDLIFSNFGGLNCLTESEITQFLKTASNRLTANGKICMVIMPEKCAWETVYFLAKFKFKSAFRRGKKNGVPANVEGKDVWTFYYSPKKIQSLATQFKTVRLNPIGLFVPPSYLEPIFKKRPQKLEKLFIKDLKRVKNERFSSVSDHYFICLEKI